MLERAPADRPIHLAISGGSTPGPIFRRLARQGHPDPARVRLYFADERAVPRDDPASNYRLARETLIDPVGIPDEHVFPMIPESWGEPTPEALQRAATAYEAVLPPRLDLILLGLGQDGHTASLFPGTGIEWPGATVPARVVPLAPPRHPMSDSRSRPPRSGAPGSWSCSSADRRRPEPWRPPCRGAPWTPYPAESPQEEYGSSEPMRLPKRRHGRRPTPPPDAVRVGSPSPPSPGARRRRIRL